MSLKPKKILIELWLSTSEAGTLSFVLSNFIVNQRSVGRAVRDVRGEQRAVNQPQLQAG